MFYRLCYEILFNEKFWPKKTVGKYSLINKLFFLHCILVVSDGLRSASILINIHTVSFMVSIFLNIYRQSEQAALRSDVFRIFRFAVLARSRIYLETQFLTVAKLTLENFLDWKTWLLFRFTILVIGRTRCSPAIRRNVTQFRETQFKTNTRTPTSWYACICTTLNNIWPCRGCQCKSCA